MGAVTFTQYGSGESLDAAFRKAREEAEYWHGHGGYTGTIAEKRDVVLIKEAGELPYLDAEEVAWELINAGDERIDDKWGPAGAIRVKGGAKRSVENGKVVEQEYDGWLFFGWASE